MNESLNPRFTRTARGYSADGRGDDPLADLARIVGSEDPFANLFDDARKATTRPEAAAPAPEEEYEPQYAEADAGYDTYGPEPDLFEAELRGAYDNGRGVDDGLYEEPYEAPEHERIEALPPARESWRADLRAPVRAEPRMEDDEDFLSSPYDSDNRQAVAEDDFDGAFDDEAEEEPRKRSSLFAMAGAVVALAVMAGGGALAFKNGLFDRTTLTAPDKAPVIMASKEPAKVIPDTAVATPAPAKEIFQKSAVREVKIEKVVSREEQPVAIPNVVKSVEPPKPTAAVPLPTRAIDLDTPTASAGISVDAKPKQVALAPVLETPQPVIGSTAVEPRKVKTVKVLADGTIVTGEAQAPARPMPPAPEDVAANEEPIDAPADAPEETAASGLPSLALPQDRPHEVAGAAQTPMLTRVAMAEQDTAGDAVDAPDTAPTPVASVPATLAMPPARPKNIPLVSEIKPLETASVPAAPKPAAAPKPVVAAKPAPAPKPVQVAAVDPAPVAATPVASGGSWTVQVSSQKTQPDATAAFAGMQRKFPSVLGGLSSSVKAADLGDRGTYYRVRVGSYASRDDATALCIKLKAAGGDCVVARY